MALNFLAREQHIIEAGARDTHRAAMTGSQSAFPPRKLARASAPEPTPRVSSILKRSRAKSRAHGLSRANADTKSRSSGANEAPGLTRSLGTAVLRTSSTPTAALPASMAPKRTPAAAVPASTAPKLILQHVNTNSSPPLTKPQSSPNTLHEPLQALGASQTQGSQCSVCYGDLTADNRPRRQITAACNLEPDICRACLTASIAAQFGNKVWDQIDCPTCRARLAYEDMKVFADSSVFGRYVPYSIHG